MNVAGILDDDDADDGGEWKPSRQHQTRVKHKQKKGRLEKKPKIVKTGTTIWNQARGSGAGMAINLQIKKMNNN